MYIDKLDNIVNKYENIYHNAIKRRPVDVKSSRYIDSSKELNNIDLKFKIGAIVRITNYRNIFAKVYTPNGLKKFLCLIKLKILCHGHMLLINLIEEKLLERFTKKKLQKTNLKEFIIEKLIKRKR